MIELAVDVVGVVVGGLVFRAGQGLGLGLDDGGGLPEVLPDARADAGDHDRAVSAALAGRGHGVDGQIKDVRLHLTPQLGGAAAAGGKDLLIVGKGAHDVHQLPEGIGDALHDGAGDVALSGAQGQAVKRGAAVGVRIGAALAGQIGGEHHAVSAGHGLLGGFAHHVVDVAPLGLGHV